jgi:hypothetical protein
VNQREEAVYRYLMGHRLDPAPPSYRAIGEAVGIGKTHVHRILHRLAEDGLLTFESRSGRRTVWRLTAARPAGWGDDRLMWCLETDRSDMPGRVLQPLSLCFSLDEAPPRDPSAFASSLLADPHRRAKWKRVRVILEEV